MIDTQKRQWDIPPFIIHIQDYHTHVSFEDTNFSDSFIFHFFKTRSHNLSPRAGP